MTDLDERIRAGVTALAEREQPAAHADDVLARLERGPIATQPSRRRPRVPAVAAVVVAVVLIATFALTRFSGHGEASRVVVGPGDTTVPSPFPAGLHDWGTGPMASSFNPTPIWDGHEVVVLGGDSTAMSAADQVAALDPATGKWRRLPVLPFVPAAPQEQFVSGTACEGDVLAFGQDGQLASLSSNEKAWTHLPTAPDVDTDALTAPVVCAGSDVLWPASGRAYSISSRTWRTIAPMPGDSVANAAAWTGRVVIVPLRTGASTVGLFSYDPASDRWRHIAPWFQAGMTEPQVAWDGTRVIALGLQVTGTAMRTVAATFDPGTGRWTAIDPVPGGVDTARRGTGELGLLSVGRTAVVLSSVGIAVLDGDHWSVDSRSGITPGWWSSIGDAVVLWSPGVGLQSYVPPR